LCIGIPAAAVEVGREVGRAVGAMVAGLAVALEAAEQAEEMEAAVTVVVEMVEVVLGGAVTEVAESAVVARAAEGPVVAEARREGPRGWHGGAIHGRHQGRRESHATFGYRTSNACYLSSCGLGGVCIAFGRKG
jgi:hypothetical protein